VSNSRYVNARIEKYYRRTADVIYPPVSADRFTLGRPKENFYLVVSRLVPYKRVDLAVAACRELDLPLMVIGQGPERARLEAAAGPRTQFLGRLSDDETTAYYERARGFIFSSEEDFGITPLEASAAGTPVIAFGKGGALETVVEGTTGLFFAEQTVESVVSAITSFEGHTFDPAACRAHAESFGEENFIAQLRDYVDTKYQDFVRKDPRDPLFDR
jgi:glycosyltransferase involved in cell wall biosynthesis